jgi:hypothetical protein
MTIHPGLNCISNARRLLGTLENALNPLLYQSGSISTLNEDLIKEATNGFSTVKRWAFDVLYKLNPSREELRGAFLTNLCKAFVLGRLQQDGRSIDDCLRHIPSAYSWKQRHPRLEFYHPSGRRIHTLPDFLAFIDGSGDLERGIRFFRYVHHISKATVNDSINDRYLVRERIPVDLAVLCKIVERLFGLAIMTEMYRGNLHGVLLPRSWVLTLWNDFIAFKERALAPLWVLAQWTETLLREIYTGEYLSRTIIDPQNFSEFGFHIAKSA